MELYDATGEEVYLNSVHKAFPYYRKYWRGNKNTAFVPWHTQAYLIFYNYTKNERVAEFVFEMNDWLIDKYQLDQIYKSVAALPGQYLRINEEFPVNVDPDMDAADKNNLDALKDFGNILFDAYKDRIVEYFEC